MPYTYNGQNVLSGDILGYAIYSRTDYDVYTFEWKSGSGYAAKPIGVRFKHQLNLSGICVVV